MPSSHRRYADWTHRAHPQRSRLRSARRRRRLCELILEHRPHPEQGFRACLGIVRLVRPFGADRLEAAATRAIEIGALTYGSVSSILDNKLDRHAAQPRGRGRRADPPPQHPRPALLPLRRIDVLTHPTLDQLTQLGLIGMAKAFAELEASGDAAALQPMPNGSPCCSIAR